MGVTVYSEFDQISPQAGMSCVRINITVYTELKEIAVDDYRLSSGRNMAPSAKTIPVKALLLRE